MDVITLRGLVTLTSFIAFVGIVIWAWKRRHTKDFKDAANLPFDEN